MAPAVSQASQKDGSGHDMLETGNSPLGDLTESSKAENADASISSDEKVEADKWRFLQIVGANLLYFNSFGLVNCYGIFQAYWKTTVIPHESDARVAWIGSLGAWLLFFVGFLSGPLFDAGYLRLLLAGSTFFVTLGLMMTSLCDEYWQFMLAQGLCLGIGMGLGLTPSITLPMTWYPTPAGRAMSMGIVTTSSSFGGIVYSVMFHYIERQSGWRWAVRAIAFVALGTNLCGSTLLKYKEKPASRRKLIDMSIVHEFDYMVMIVGVSFVLMSVYTPAIWIQLYWLFSGHDSDATVFFWLIPIMLAGGLPGRLVPNGLAIKFGAYNMFLVVALCCTILNLCWIAVHSRGAIITFAVFYGFFNGGVMSLTGPAAMSAAPTQHNMATRIGMASGFGSFGILAGLPLNGQILWSTDDYLGTQLFSGITILVGIIILIWSRSMMVGTKGRPPVFI
jgi:MFS family permease